MDCRSKKSSDGTRSGQSRLGTAIRAGDRRDRRGFRSDRIATEPPGTARLACGSIQGFIGLVAQRFDSHDRALEHLPAVLRVGRSTQTERSQKCLAKQGAALQAQRRSHPGSSPWGQRPSEQQARRPAGHAPTARGALAIDLLGSQVDHKSR